MKKNKKTILASICLALAGLAWVKSQSAPENEFAHFKFKPTSPSMELAAETTSQEKNRKNSSESNPPISKVGIDRRPAQATQEETEAQRRARRFLELKRARLTAERRGKTEPVGDFSTPTGQSYRLVENLVAVKADAQNANDYPQAQMVGGHYIIEGQQTPGRSAFVVKNAKTGKLAVFTGVIRVKVTDFDQGFSLADRYGAEVSQSYEHINTVFLKFDEYGKTLSAHKELSKEGSVKRAEIEVLEYSRQQR